MPNCIIPGCAKEGTRLHQVELPGSEHLLCDGHYELLFVSGMAGEEDLRVYNTAYQAILEQRRAAAKAKEAGLVELPDAYLAGTDILVHGGPCASCGKKIEVQKGVPFTMGIGEDGTRVCPECMKDVNELLGSPAKEPEAKEAAAEAPLGPIEDAEEKEADDGEEPQA